VYLWLLLKKVEIKLTVEMNSTYATQNTANRIDLLNADDFATYQNRIITNGGGGTPYIQGLQIQIGKT
jgi:hypothetical protein